MNESLRPESTTPTPPAPPEEDLMALFLGPIKLTDLGRFTDPNRCLAADRAGRCRRPTGNAQPPKRPCR